MPNRKKRSNSGLWWLTIIGIAVVAGLAWYAKNQPLLHGTDSATTSPAGRTSKPGPPVHDTVRILTPSYNGDKLQFTEKDEKPTGNQDPMVYAVNEFLNAAKFCPPKARLVSVKVADKTATLEFSPEFEQTYGTEDEQTLLSGIQHAMGQFPQVEQLVFRVGGKPLETLGNVPLTDPIPVLR